MYRTENHLSKILEQKIQILEELINEIDMDNVVKREIMTASELSEYCNINLEQINVLKTQKKIPYYQYNERTYFYKEDIDKWLKAEKQILHNI